MKNKYVPFKDKELEESRKKLSRTIARLKAKGVKFNYKYVKNKK